MIQAEAIRSLTSDILKERQLFLVEVVVNTPGKVTVYLDSMKGVTVDDCAAVSRLIETWMNAEGEDCELEVSSPGLQRSLLLPVQYEKHIGRKVDVLRKDGIRVQGMLRSYSEGVAAIETEKMVRESKKGKRKRVTELKEIEVDQIIKAKIIIS